MTPALSVHNLSCEYYRWGQKVQALQNLSLTVPEGQWLMIAGHNGAGKSTLLRIAAGLVSDYTGEVEIAGRPARRLSPPMRAHSVFYVHQDPTLGSAPMLTVFENLLIADPGAAGFSRGLLERRYNELLSLAGLQSRLHHPAHYLSGGERQLLAFLIARLRPSKLVLLDEALAALDPSRTAVCLQLLNDLQRDGRTLLFVTHSLRLASSYGDRTIVLAQGRAVYDAVGAARDSTRMRHLIDAATNIEETQMVGATS